MGKAVEDIAVESTVLVGMVVVDMAVADSIAVDRAVVAVVDTADMDNHHCNLEVDTVDNYGDEDDGDVNVDHNCNLDMYNSCYSGTDSCYSLDMGNCCNRSVLYNIRKAIKLHA